MQCILLSIGLSQLKLSLLVSFLFCSQSKQFNWLNIQHAVLLELLCLKHIFFHMTCRLGTFSLLWRYVWTLNFFFFLHCKFLFFTYLDNFFFQRNLYMFSILDKFLKENRILDLYSEIYDIFCYLSYTVHSQI